VGIHDTRFSTAFPVRYEEELIMYVSFELLRPEPAHMEIQVKRPGSRDSESFAESVCDPDSSLVVIAPLPMATFEFNRPGKFNFALYVDHLLVGSTRIVVEQAPIHAAQARVQAN
ncbi:MAG TPA: hypothetical protein VHO25_06975, partial [Polyangiaceae bacterium]|nr:hypothetical protein [Polyangiaceae bacterium]